MEISTNCVTLHFNDWEMDYGILYDVSLSSADMFIVREFITYKDKAEPDNKDYVIFTDGVREIKEFCLQRLNLLQTYENTKDVWYRILYSTNTKYSKLLKEQENFLSFVDLH